MMSYEEKINDMLRHSLLIAIKRTNVFSIVHIDIDNGYTISSHDI
jgi:hypothetical protein